MAGTPLMVRASMGDLEAQREIAGNFFGLSLGEGAAGLPNLDRAIHWARQAAAQGDLSDLATLSELLSKRGTAAQVAGDVVLTQALLAEQIAVVSIIAESPSGLGSLARPTLLNLLDGADRTVIGVAFGLLHSWGRSPDALTVATAGSTPAEADEDEATDVGAGHAAAALIGQLCDRHDTDWPTICAAIGDLPDMALLATPEGWARIAGHVAEQLGGNPAVTITFH